jgi:hypothetical protein
MSTKLYDKKTAAFAAFVIQAMPDGLTEEIMDGWMQNPSALKKVLEELRPPKGLVAEVERITLPELPGGTVRSCFNSLYLLRPDDNIRSLPDQGPRPESVVTIVKPGKRFIFPEMAEYLTGVLKPAKELGEEIVDKGLTITLQQVHSVIVGIETSKFPSLAVYGVHFLCFVETGDSDEPVCVIEFTPDSNGYWRVCRHYLDDNLVRDKRHWFLLCNADVLQVMPDPWLERP